MPARMTPGRLRERITLLAPTRPEQGDQYGAQVPADAVESVVPACVEPLSGRELWNARQVQAEVTYRVTIRFRPGPAPDWKIAYRGRVFHISFVIDPEERHEWLEFLCVEEV